MDIDNSVLLAEIALRNQEIVERLETLLGAFDVLLGILAFVLVALGIVAGIHFMGVLWKQL